MRNLEVVRRTTPTFLFQITDAASSGVSLDGMGVCMAILEDGETDGSLIKRHILPATLGGVPVNYFNESNEGTSTSIVPYKNNRYCQNLTNGLFSVTLPYALDPVTDVVSYQVFLFRMEEMATPTRDVTVRVDNVTIGDDIIPGQYQFMSIPIDSGTITFLDSNLPLLKPAAKRNNAVII